jgi:hypothetical protein
MSGEEHGRPAKGPRKPFCERVHIASARGSSHDAHPDRLESAGKAGPELRVAVADEDLAGTISIDFLTVPTATFRTLYVFVVLSLERRLLLHVNVTAHPYAAWAAQQMVEATGPEVQALRLIRDRADRARYSQSMRGHRSLISRRRRRREVELQIVGGTWVIVPWSRAVGHSERKGRYHDSTR